MTSTELLGGWGEVTLRVQRVSYRNLSSGQLSVHGEIYRLRCPLRPPVVLGPVKSCY